MFFYSLEAGIADVIPSFKWMKTPLRLQNFAQSWQYRDRRKPEVVTISYSYQMVSSCLYSAQYPGHHYKLQAFEQFGAL